MAELILGDGLELATRYVAHLADTGVTHGLIGPRETPRLWERHILNCAVLGELIDDAAQLADEPAARRTVVDVGSGAGLPGIPLAIVRPDLRVHLIEPLARRTTWLEQVVADLHLVNVTVHTARAEALWGQVCAGVVTARAVSTLENLAAWSLPLLDVPGVVLAMKGRAAEDELRAATRKLSRLGVTQSEVVQVGTALLEQPTTVARLSIDAAIPLQRFRQQPTSSAGSARRRAHRAAHRGAGSPSHGPVRS